MEVISKSLWKVVRELFQQTFERIWPVDYLTLQVKESKASLFPVWSGFKSYKICPVLIKADGSTCRVQEKTGEQASARAGGALRPGNPLAEGAVSQRWVMPGATCRPRRPSLIRSSSVSGAPGFLADSARAADEARGPQVPTLTPAVTHSLACTHSLLLTPARWQLGFSTEVESQTTLDDRAPADASIPCVSSRLRFQLLWLFRCLLGFSFLFFSFSFFFFFFFSFFLEGQKHADLFIVSSILNEAQEEWINKTCVKNYVSNGHTALGSKMSTAWLQLELWMLGNWRKRLTHSVLICFWLRNYLCRFIQSPF